MPQIFFVRSPNYGLTNRAFSGNIYRQSTRLQKTNMGVFPSGQWGQTVNLLLSASVVRIHPRPPRTPVSNGYRSFCFISLEKGDARVDSNSNSDDRCLRQKQGEAVGAAASRMRVPPKARRSRWEPRPGLLILRGSRRPPAPTKKPQRIKIRCGFCLVVLFSLRPPVRAAVPEYCFEQ